MHILALNAGSATLKFKLIQKFALGSSTPAETVLADGTEEHSGGENIAEAAERVMARCRSLGVDAIGHRVVHGGPLFTTPTRVTREVVAQLRELKALDPLHNPIEIAMIEAGLRVFPGIPSVALFDTSFHRTLPEYAWRYALPFELADTLRLRRYGFHGLSHQYVSAELIRRLSLTRETTRLIICHLGSGSSVCAVKGGESIDTSMGFTPLEGLVMGTRSGDIDPGLVLYLIRSEKMTGDAIDNLLNNKSGLAGMTGGSGDVREVEQAARNGDTRAEMALEIFAYRVSKYIGAYAVALGGVDAVAFTGGIGEHSEGVRARICNRLGFLGISLDGERNAQAEGAASQICANESPVRVWVIRTNEELQIVRETYALLAAA